MGQSDCWLSVAARAARTCNLPHTRDGETSILSCAHDLCVRFQSSSRIGPIQRLVSLSLIKLPQTRSQADAALLVLILRFCRLRDLIEFDESSPQPTLSRRNHSARSLELSSPAPDFALLCLLSFWRCRESRLIPSWPPQVRRHRSGEPGSGLAADGALRGSDAIAGTLLPPPPFCA